MAGNLETENQMSTSPIDVQDRTAILEPGSEITLIPNTKTYEMNFTEYGQSVYRYAPFSFGQTSVAISKALAKELLSEEEVGKGGVVSEAEARKVAEKINAGEGPERWKLLSPDRVRGQLPEVLSKYPEAGRVLQELFNDPELMNRLFSAS